LTANSGAPPSWQTVSASGAITGVTGTANEVIVSGPVAGVVTLSTPQAIATTSNVQFNNITFTALFANLNGSVIYDNLGGPCLAINDPGSVAVNSWKMYGGPTGAGPHLAAFGSDTNVAGQILGQGTGGVLIQGISGSAASPAGFVGELIQSVINSASSVTFTSATINNLTSISLTAGDWDLWGNINWTGTTTSSADVWISTTSLTAPDRSLINGIFGVPTGTSLGLSAPNMTLQLSSTTTVYLSGAVIGTGTLAGAGGLYARRRR